MRRRRPHPRRRAAIAATAVLVAWFAGLLIQPRRTQWTRHEILDAIRAVESGGRADPPDGDGGLAIGPYQIHRVYWQDAMAADPSLGGRYEDCRTRDYAERVIASYMRRYVPDAWARGDAEVIARTHNGGPEGAAKPATDRYWGRVLAALP
ncbi:MAG: hypothetical protein U1F36_16420 [Planctomycetota bacterium]